MSGIGRLRGLAQFARSGLRLRGIRADVRGALRPSGLALSLRYLGFDEYLEVIVARLFGPDASVTTERRPYWHAAAARDFRAGLPQVDLLVAHLPPAYCGLVAATGADAWEVPCWIMQRAPLSGSWEDVVARFRKNTRTTDLRKVRKHGLRARVTRDPRALTRFYHELYSPHAKRRFGRLAVIDSLEEVQADVRAHGELLEVLQGERVVGGCELSLEGDRMELLCFGLAAHLDRALADATQSAIYLFAFQHAHGRGCQELGFALTRPFLDDGIYRYKRKWGTVVHDGFGGSAFLWQPQHLGPGVRAALSANPTLVRTREGLVGKVMLAQAIDEQALLRLGAQYLSPGVTRLDCFGLHPTPLTPAEADAHPQLRWVDLSSCDDAAALSQLARAEARSGTDARGLSTE